jgi:hypothetical protein
VTEKTRTGELPRDARQKLIAASKIGRSGSLVRRSAIDKAYRYIEERYPEYLHPSYNQPQEDN